MTTPQRDIDEAVRAVELLGDSVAEVAERKNVHPATVRSWLRRHRAEHGPQQQELALDADGEQHVLDLWRTGQGATISQIARTLKVHPSHVQTVLVRHRVSPRDLREQVGMPVYGLRDLREAFKPIADSGKPFCLTYGLVPRFVCVPLDQWRKMDNDKQEQPNG